MKLVSNVLTLAILSAFTASSVADVGTLNFNFAGVIPAKTVQAAGWKFVNAAGDLYIAPGSISMSAETDADENVVLTSNSEEFYIKPNEGNAFLNTPITAQLVAAPTITGSAILPSKFNLVAPTITINGKEVGAAATTEILTVSIDETLGAKRMVLGANVLVPEAARAAEGGNVTLQTTIRFAADIETV